MSTIGFSAVRDWLEAGCLVLQRERPELRLVNATEGGARIAGFEELGLADLLATLPDRQISAESIRQDAEAARGRLEPERIRDWCVAQTTFVQAIRHAARRLRRLCQTSQIAIERKQPNKIAAGFQKLEVAERQLKEAVAKMPFVDVWAHAEIDRALDKRTPNEPSRDEHDSAVRSVALEAALAQVLERSALELEEKFQELARSATEPRTAEAGSNARPLDANDS